MNTKLLSFLFTIILSVVAISCSKDDKENQNEPENKFQSIVGEWKCLNDAYGDPWEKPLIYLFSEDGTGYEWFMEEPFTDRWVFSYKTTDSKLLITAEGRTQEYRYELSSDCKSLVIYGIDDDDMAELHFTRSH